MATKTLSLTSSFDFFNEYVDYASECTDAPKGYHKLSSFALLSAAIQRKVRVRFAHDTIYPNIWGMSLGPSGIVRKSTAQKLAKDILPNSIPLTSQESTPQGLVAELERNSHGIWVRDEVGGFLAMLKQKYMRGTEDLLNDVYCCPDNYRKTLSQRNYSLTDVYLTLLWATTPTRFKRNTRIDQILSGFIPRFIFSYPSLDNWTPRRVRQRGKTLDQKEQKLRDILEKTADFFSSQKEPLDLEFEDEALDTYNDWADEVDERIKAITDEEVRDVKGAIWTRIKEYAVKLAILKHVNDNLKDIVNFNKFEKLKIQKFSIEFGIERAEEYAEHAWRVVELYEVTESKNLLNLIRKHGGTICHSDLLRQSGLKAKDLKKQINKLKQQGKIVVQTNPSSGPKPRTIYIIK